MTRVIVHSPLTVDDAAPLFRLRMSS